MIEKAPDTQAPTMIGFIKDTVHTTHASIWAQLRACYAGEKTIKALGISYLPMLTDQTTVEYDAYVARAYFFNMVRRTVLSVVGMATRKPPRIKPSEANDLLEDEVVDNRGNNVLGFTTRLLMEATLMGRALILLDYCEEEDKPVFLLYKTEDIWTVERNRAGTVIRLVLHEEVKRPLQNHHYARELILENGVYIQNQYDLGNGTVSGVLDDSATPKKRGQTFDFLPAWLFDMEGEDAGESIITPLSALNLAHYRQVADYKHLLHYCSIPTLILTGVPDNVDENGVTTPPQIKVGAENVIILNNPDASGKWVGAGSDAATPIRNELNDLEGRMSSASISVAVSAVSRETATSSSQRNSANTASVTAIIREVNDMMSKALNEYVQWRWGSIDKIRYSAPLDFSANVLDGQTILALLAAYNGGTMSIESFLDNLSRGELLADSTPEEEMKRLLNPTELPESPAQKMAEDLAETPEQEATEDATEDGADSPVNEAELTDNNA